MNILLGFFIYHMVAGAILMTQFWAIPDETLQELIDSYEGSDGFKLTKRSLYLVVVFFAWLLLPLIILSPRGK